MAVTVTRDLVRAYSATLITLFNNTFTAQAGVSRLIATWVPSTQMIEEYGWIGELPVMREWVDERTVKSLSEYGFTIRNRKFESTIGVAREVIEDERHAQVRMQVMSMAEAADAHYDQILFELINQGETAKAYDGVAFYSEGRVVAGRPVANLTSEPLSAESLQSVLSQMMKTPLPNGEPMAVMPTHLLVPPALQWTARTLLNSAFTPDAEASAGAGQSATNPLRGALSLVVSPRLATDTEWHVIDAGRAVKPYIIQQRTPVEFSALDDPDTNEAAFLRDEFLYGVRSRDNAGFGLWQYAYKSTGAG